MNKVIVTILIIITLMFLQKTVSGQTKVYIPVILIKAPEVQYIIQGSGVELFPDANPPFQYNWWDYQVTVINHLSYSTSVTYECGVLDSNGVPIMNAQIPSTITMGPGQQFTQMLRFHFNHPLPSPAAGFSCRLKTWSKIN